MQSVTAATIGGAMFFGMSQSLLAHLKLAVARRAPMTDSYNRRALLTLNIAFVPLVLLCGVLIDVRGARLMLVAGSAALALGLLSLSARPAYPGALAALLLASFGAAALGSASTVLMPRAFFTASETAASVNLGYVFIALGAALTPLTLAIPLHKLEPRRTLALLALLSLLPAFLAVMSSWPSVAGPTDAPSFFAGPAGWLEILIVVFYAPLESLISPWTLTLLAERGQEEGEATKLLSGFWAAFVLSRLLTALVGHQYYLSEQWDKVALVIAPLLAAVVLGNLMGASQRGLPRAGLVLLGLLLGPVLPTLLAVVFRRIAWSEHGTAYGMLFAAGSLGSAVLAPSLPLPTRPTLQTALRVPIFLALLVTAIALLWGLMIS